VDPRRRMVRDGYDAVADQWIVDRRRGAAHPSYPKREGRWLERFYGKLPQGARVLDLGCGGGEPILAALIERGYHTTGVDFSRSQLRLARARCPESAFVEGDLVDVELPAASFDGAVAYDSLWHLPLADQARVFERLRGWLIGGAPALVTVAVVDPGGEGADHELLGRPMFYAVCSYEKTLAMLDAAGFAVEDHDFDVPDGGHTILLLRAV